MLREAESAYLRIAEEVEANTRAMDDIIKEDEEAASRRR